MNNKLNQFLADLSVAAKKVQNFHWNIEGKGFFTVHAKLDDIYEALNENSDEIAERILALGGRPLSNMRSYLEISKIQEAENKAVIIEEAISEMIKDIQYLVDEAKEVKVLADETSDYGTSAMIDEFIINNEKLLWMLRAYIK